MSSIHRKTHEINRFGEKLRILRTHQGWTLQQLAVHLDLVAHGYISELETGKKTPTAAIVLKIARLFDISTDTLLKDEVDLILPNKKVH